MSLLSSLLLRHILPSLESAFIAHEPDMQAELLAEVKALSMQLESWIQSKASKQPSAE